MPKNRLRTKRKSIKLSISSGKENEMWRFDVIEKRAIINRCGKIDKLQIFNVFFYIYVCRVETAIDSTSPLPPKNKIRCLSYFTGFENRYRFCWLPQMPLFNFVVWRKPGMADTSTVAFTGRYGWYWLIQTEVLTVLLTIISNVCAHILLTSIIMDIVNINIDNIIERVRLLAFTSEMHLHRTNRIYSVRGLERSELVGSHGCPGRLWERFLWQVYQNDNRHDALDGV